MWLVKTKRSPYWQARWDAPDGSGRVISESTREVAKRAAEARGAELEAADIARWKREQGGGAVLSSRVIEEYWETEGQRKKSAGDHIFPHLARIATFLGDKPYCDVTIADVARFADELTGTISDSTINRALSVWRRIHNVAGKKRLYPVHIIDWSEVRRSEPEMPARSLTRDQIKDLLRRLPVHAQQIVIFAVATGARRAQVLGLTWDRVNFEDATATIYKKHTKKYVQHHVPLNGTAMAVLEQRRAATANGAVFDTRNFRKLWDSAVAGAGLAGVRFHDLRHTAGHLAARASLAAAKELLGHSDVRVTLRYARARQEDVRHAVDQMPLLEIERDTESDT